MTPYEFIAKWSASELKERSASQEHFIDLCRLLGEPTPAEADPRTASSGALARILAGTAGPMSGSATTSPGSTRESEPISTLLSDSFGPTRWRWRTRRF